jgi:dipeptidyl aminopeptidase/acylaminoacyl peptidase
MVHGEFDRASEIFKQFWPMVRALKSSDEPPETFVRRFERHGFTKEQNNIELYTAMQDFLSRSMPTPANPAPASLAVTR